jgi:hypothetical protein
MHRTLRANGGRNPVRRFPQWAMFLLAMRRNGRGFPSVRFADRTEVVTRDDRGSRCRKYRYNPILSAPSQDFVSWLLPEC